MNTQIQTEERDAVEDLLPWYVVGTLDARDMARVDAALQSDPELARRLEIARDEMGETVLSNQAMGAPSAKVLDKLFASIDAEPVRKPAMSASIFDLGGRLASWLQPRTLAWATIAGAFVIALQAGMMTDIIGSSGKTYETASKQQGAGVLAGTFVLVTFAPEATAAQIASLLGEAGGSIVEGPRAGGIYRVRIGGADFSTVDRDLVIALFKAKSGVIRFVAAGN